MTMKSLFAIVLVMFVGIAPSFSQTKAFQVSGPYASAGQNRNELMIPNAFTPNNDGQNDIFKIKNITNQRLIDFKVFNRWGTVVFRTTDPTAGWDGTSRGQIQPIGVYGYVIQIGFADGYVETYKGTVTLIK